MTGRRTCDEEVAATNWTVLRGYFGGYNARDCKRKSVLMVLTRFLRASEGRPVSSHRRRPPRSRLELSSMRQIDQYDRRSRGHHQAHTSPCTLQRQQILQRPRQPPVKVPSAVTFPVLLSLYRRFRPPPENACTRSPEASPLWVSRITVLLVPDSMSAAIPLAELEFSTNRSDPRVIGRQAPSGARIDTVDREIAVILEE